MSNKTFSLPRIVMTALAVLLALSACSALPYKSSGESIRSIAGQISGYSLPEGYSEQFALDVMGYQLVSLQGPTPNCHIYLVQAPKGTEIDIAKMQEQARSMEGTPKRERWVDVRVVEQRSVTLRGEASTLLVGEGTNSEDQPYREVTALFPGRGGPALVSISSPETYWDWDQVNAFLASLE